MNRLGNIRNNPDASPWFRTGLLVSAIVCSLAASLPASAEEEGSFQRTLKVTGNLNIDVATGSGTIQVRVGSSDEVQVMGRIRSTQWFGGNAEEKIKRIENDPPIQQNGNEIRIGHIDDPELTRNLSISYEIIVPAQTRLRAQTGSGRGDVQGILGSVDISSGSGSLKISGIGDTVRADTGSG